MVADFMAQARDLLAEVSREPDFIPQTELKTLHGGGAASAVLQTDPDGLTLMLGLFSPKAETPVHDHKSWGGRMRGPGKGPLPPLAPRR